MNPLLLTGPAVAIIGIVAVFFVMRHKSVEKRSMYSSRRSQIEHKVRAARQRTLAPTKRGEKESQAVEGGGTSASTPAVTYEASAYAGPPVAPPPLHPAPARSAWDVGPTAPAPSMPTFTPPAPAFEPPAAEPPPAETPQAQPAWTPTPAAPEPTPPERPAPAPVAAATSAGAGASWSIVGESKGTPEPEPTPLKKKGSKDEARTGAWQLASGEVAGEEGDEGIKPRNAALAVAQYAALVLGLCLVLIGVVVMVANQHGT
jgi:hypothetical protein